jgi:hypothetical protein
MRSGLGEMGCNMLLENFNLIRLKFVIIQGYRYLLCSFRGTEEGEGEKETKMEYTLDVYHNTVAFSANRAQQKF